MRNAARCRTRERGDPRIGARVDYEAPRIVDYGTLTELTAAQADGNFTDREFPVNTPKQDLTFSD